VEAHLKTDCHHVIEMLLLVAFSTKHYFFTCLLVTINFVNNLVTYITLYRRGGSRRGGGGGGPHPLKLEKI
jgi:hypothetical protein